MEFSAPDWASLFAMLQASAETASAWLGLAGDFLANPWARTIGLCVIVYATIRVIASVYSGDMQNSELGPIGIRPHVARRLDRETVMFPRLLMPMNMDGVSSSLKLFYVFTDARGKRIHQHIYSRRNTRIAVTPVRLPKHSGTVFGQEIPDLATADVCFPQIEFDATPQHLDVTPDRALDYAALHKVIENWTEDDEAPLISVHPDVHDEIVHARLQFIMAEAAKVAAAREARGIGKWLRRNAALRRPNVVGSFYVKLEFSHDPWFVLTKHPDRELKMTAWLTVLTSMFALVMEAWPESRHSGSVADPPSAVERSPIRPPRVMP